MIKNYIKRSAMLLGAAAVVATASAEGAFVDVTHKYLKEATYMPGWQGVITATSDGVAEVWNGAFRAYQVIEDAPAGEYTLTANALYRCGTNDYSKANMKGKDVTPELYTAYIFINDTKATVSGLFDGGKEVGPNNRFEANAAFEAGEYVNTVKATHNGGDLVIGIANTGTYHDEWCCFDNFKLVGPEGEIALENGDFSTGIDSKRAWNNVSSENKEKTPDMQKDGAGGGDYRKCGGSPYNYGQQVTLPAGKYRFSMLTFHRYGSTLSPDGTYFDHKTGAITDAYGDAGRTPKDWFEANDYDDNTTYSHAFLFMSKAAEKPVNMKWNTQRGGKLNPETDVRARIKDCWEICNGNFAEMPQNSHWWEELPYETRNFAPNHDSGDEREAAAAFVANPEKWYQYVEFELTQPETVWVGMAKDTNTGDGFWHAWADQKLEMYVEGAGVDNVIADGNENAPVEYYNLQGVRVENPANGLYIKRQGNKATKVLVK